MPQQARAFEAPGIAWRAWAASEMICGVLNLGGGGGGGGDGGDALGYYYYYSKGFFGVCFRYTCYCAYASCT